MWICALIPVFILFSGVPFGVQQADAACPGDYKQVPNTETCIQVFSGKAKTWDKASSKCRKTGGDLLTIHDKNTFNGLKNTNLIPARGTFWIGLNDKVTEGKYVWLAGNKQATFHNLNLHPQYTRHAATQDCIVMMTSGTFSWFMQPCGSKMHFICEHKG